MSTMQSFWLNMKSVLRSARQVISSNLQPLGITSAQGDILYQLFIQQEGMTQEELTKRLDVGKAAVSRTIDSLVSNGFVQRIHHQSDGRANSIILTQKAYQTGEQVVNIYHQVYETLIEDFSKEDFESIIKLLDRVSEKLKTIEETNDY